MIYFTALNLMLALVSSTAIQPTRRQCGTRDYDQWSDTDMNHEEAVSQAISNGAADSKLDFPVTVQTYFHVISDGTQDAVTDQMIKDQVAVLNKDYDSSLFQFNLASINRITNSAWFTVAVGSTEEQEMKTQLRKGGAGALNVYLARLGGGLLGWATFPQDYQTNPAMDGVVILDTSLPGGSSAPFNLGRTLTHEAGHWFGLYHTFQDGCSYPNDFVTDTVPERNPAFGKCMSKKTCTATSFSKKADKEYFVTNDSGIDKKDDTTNYMDYSDDACMSHFTTGQYARMKAQWLLRSQ